MKLQDVLPILLCITFLAVPYSASAEKVGGGDITFAPENAPRVLFSHERHVVEKGFKCTNCHYQIFPPQQGSQKIQMQMEKIKEGDFCGKCHNGQKAFDVKEKTNCSRCHKQ